MSSSPEHEFDQSLSDFITSLIRTAVAAFPPPQDDDEEQSFFFTVYSDHPVVNNGPLPASKSAIEAIPTVEVTAEEDCAICLTEYGGGGGGGAGEVKELPCRHRYHSDCIRKWLGIHGSCPVCRYEMPVDEEEKRRRDGGDGEGEWWRVVISVMSRSQVSEPGWEFPDSVESSGSPTDFMDID